MARKYLISSSVVLALTVAVFAFGAWVSSPGRLPPQPIAFNHRLHLERVQGITCQDCHVFVVSRPYAGLPSKHICFGCHDPNADKDDTKADALKEQFARLMAFAQIDDEIPWHRVTALPEDVFFSHRLHVTVAKLDCRQCHAEMPNRTSPPERGPMEMKMSTCIRCHEQNNASVDCVSCHR